MKTTLNTITRRVLMLALLAAVALPVGAQTYHANGIYYKKIEGSNQLEVTYKDTTYNTYSGNIVIPAKIYNGLTVAGVGDKAFKDCDQLTNVEWKGYVSFIAPHAFLFIILNFLILRQLLVPMCFKAVIALGRSTAWAITCMSIIESQKGCLRNV